MNRLLSMRLFYLSCAFAFFFLMGSFDTYGQKVDPDAKPFQISGSLGGNLSYYSVNGIPKRRQPWGYSLFGAVNMKIYNFSIPFSVAISQQGTRFSQPFSRFGASPEYKWVKLHLGYRNLKYSEFTLNGVSFLGGGVELTPGKFRFSAMAGRFKKAIETPESAFERPQFKRMGYGVKIGYGEQSFIDFSFFHAKDDVTSLENIDSLDLRTPPQASNAIGVTGKIASSNNKWIFDYDLGASIFTRDLTAREFSDDTELFTSFTERFNVNTSSNAAWAGKSGFQYRGKFFNAGIKYRYVQAGYQTLGANYLLNDLEMITLNAGTNLFKNKLAISGSYGIQNNDLSNSKFAETGRNIGSANVNFRPNNQWNFNLSFSNFSIYQTVLKDSLFADSVVVDQTNYQINFSGSYVVVSPEYTHTYTLNTNFQSLADQREDPRQDAGNQLMSLMFNYGIRFNEKNYGLSIGANYQDFSSLLTTQTRYGGNISFNIHFMDRKLSMRLKQTWNRSVLADYNDNIFNTQWSGSYTLAKKHSINASVGFISREGRNSFSEWRTSLGYRMRF